MPSKPALTVKSVNNLCEKLGEIATEFVDNAANSGHFAYARVRVTQGVNASKGSDSEFDVGASARTPELPGEFGATGNISYLRESNRSANADTDLLLDLYRCTKDDFFPSELRTEDDPATDVIDDDLGE